MLLFLKKLMRERILFLAFQEGIFRIISKDIPANDGECRDYGKSQHVNYGK